MDEHIPKFKERLTSSQKNANSKAWYKHKADELVVRHGDLVSTRNGVSEYKRMKVNYDLHNNVLNLKDFEYVCKPNGAQAGELPATMVNRDISSTKIKALLGMEMKRPFSWKVLATNPEATSRKEQEEAKRIRDYVIAEIVGPIRKKIEAEKQAEMQGKELSEEEIQQINASIDKELNAMTPPEVKKYMEREHQDPAEVMSHQLLEYLMEKTDIRRKFNTAMKHLSLSAKEVVHVGIFNGEPEVTNIDSMKINARMSSMSPFMEFSDTISVEYDLSPSEIVQKFRDELTDKEIDRIYEKFREEDSDRQEDLFYQAELEDLNGEDMRVSSGPRVYHTMWRGLRKMAFLTYLDDEGEEQEMMVDEKYKLNPEGGDLNIEYEWLVEAYETWKIGEDIYVHMRPIPGQFKDMDNLNMTKFPYYGVQLDDMNSVPTSPMDRLKFYQYYYNIVMYRLELLLASDKGKKVLMNINAIPDSKGIDLDTWQYFFESSPFMWFNPNEEGTGYQDVNTMAKTIDLSLASDIAKYIDLAMFLKREAGASLGITEAVEGQAGPGDSVGNNRQNLIQTSNILEPLFDLHNSFKKNVLTALIETAKIAYSDKESVKLSYVLDDMSLRRFKLDVNLLENSTLGLFVANSTKAEEAMQTIKQLAHAAMQNQKAELSDILAVIRQEGIVEAEETLKVAEKTRKEEDAQIAENQNKQAQEIEQMRQKGEQQKHENEKELVVLKETERRKTVIAGNALTGMSFNADADSDDDGVNDFLEIARDGVDAEIKRGKNRLDMAKLDQAKKEHNDKMKLENKKLKQSKSKN